MVTSGGNEDHFSTIKRPLFKESSFYEQKEQQIANQFYEEKSTEVNPDESSQSTGFDAIC